MEKSVHSSAIMEKIALLRKQQSGRDQTRPASPLIPPPLTLVRPDCSKCSGRGWVRKDVPFGHPDFGKAFKCGCEKIISRDERTHAARFPDDFREATFESYLRLPLAQQQRKIAMRVQTFVLGRLTSRYSGRKRALYLHGRWGVGKTGLAISALQQAIAEGKTVLYLPTVTLFESLYEAIAASQRLRNGYGENADKEEDTHAARLLRQVEQVQWLVLDDLGVECRSRFVIQRLYQILEQRRGNVDRYTIFTSNRDARGLERHWREDGSKTSGFDDGMRIIERLGEYCVPIHIVGHNLREKSIVESSQSQSADPSL